MKNQLHAIVENHRHGSWPEVNFHSTKLVSGKKGVKEGFYNFVTKRGMCKGDYFKNILTQVGNRIGHYLGISD